MKTKFYQTSVFFTIALILLTACSIKGLTNEGKVVPENKRIKLIDGGPYKGQWETPDLVLEYTYTREPNRLVMSGQVKFKRSKNLDIFDLEANLLDASGTIITIRNIATAGGRMEVEVVPVEAEMQVPAETRAVAFSYSGSTRGTGQGSGSSKSFWRTPL